jgi:protein-disulfide isomerase
MLSLLSKTIVVFLIALSGSFSFSQDLAVNQLLKDLEANGMLDKAVERSLNRIRNKNEMLAKREAEKESKLRNKLAANVKPVDVNKDFIYGRIDADISIILYSDFECSYCQRFHAVPKAVVDQMPEKVNLVWRNFPLPFHDPMATKEAMGGICVHEQGGNAAFWKYADQVVVTTKLNGQGMPVEQGGDPITKLVSSQGIDVDKFKACLSSAATKSKIDEDLKSGADVGIRGTPGVILINRSNGRAAALAGAVPAEVVTKAVQALLAKDK